MKEIIEYFRTKYPEAVKVTFTVGYHSAHVSVENTVENNGFFYHRTLGGTWIEKVEADTGAEINNEKDLQRG
jgi:hypothetical protein